MKNLLYMSKCGYGGWKSNTIHLNLKYNYPIYKITKRDEKNQRDFGYGCKYLNCSIEKIITIPDLLITAIDKTYYKYLDQIPTNTHIIIHDPTEVRGKSKLKLRENLKRFKIITIRKQVQEYLLKTFNLESTFKYHPFYEYKKQPKLDTKLSASISRIDYDKNIDILVKANDKLREDKKIKIYGSPNDLYVYHSLKETNFKQYYMGRFKKTFEALDDILHNKKYVVDMSTIKNDGGGSQYTFLEAIYQDCILIINKKWLTKSTALIPNVNCLVAENEDDICKILESDTNYTKILKKSKRLLYNHLNVKW